MFPPLKAIRQREKDHVCRVMEEERKKFLILVLVGLFFCTSFAVVVNSDVDARHRSDIYLRWYATRKLFSEGRNLYDARNGVEVTTSVYGSPWTTNFFYPAHLLLFAAPLSLLPYPVAHLLWTLTIQLLYVVAIWLIARLVGWPGSVNRLTVLLVLAVLFIPSLRHTIWGQFNTIGLLSLALCYHALRAERYALAGVWAVGLTFKPHLFLLTLQFLLIWTLASRERWRFYLGFLPACLAMWAMAELAQPGWVLDFIPTLRTYGPVAPLVEQISAVQIVAVVGLGLATLLLGLQRRDASADTSAFAGCISLTLASSCIVILAIGLGGMAQVVVLPVAVVLLLSHLRRTYPSLYTHAVWALLLVYCLGVVGFAIDLQLHTFFWSELAYSLVGPILVIALSIPLCLRTRPEFMRLSA